MVRNLMIQKSHSNNRFIISLLSLVAFIILILIFALVLKNNYEVVEKGRLLEYSSGFVYKVRLFDKFTLIVEPECHNVRDVFTSFLLYGLAFISLTYALLIAKITKCKWDNKYFKMFVTLFFGMSYLGFDEILGIHESIGHNMVFLMELPFIKRPDDAIIVSYLIPVSGFLYYFRRELLSNRTSLWVLAGAVFFLSVATLADVFTFKIPVEEISEIIASLCLITAFLLLGLNYLNNIIEHKSRTSAI